jgi:hypothetical protein
MEYLLKPTTFFVPFKGQAHWHASHPFPSCAIGPTPEPTDFYTNTAENMD